MSNKITLETLKKLNACREQLDKFQELFPSGVIPTLELAEKYAKIFQWGCAAENLLSPNGHDEFYKIRDATYNEFYKIATAAWDEYMKIYNANCNNEKICNPALNEYEKIQEAAMNEYQKKIACAFVTLYIKENS